MFKHQDLQMFCVKLLEKFVIFTHSKLWVAVVGRGSETQLYVREKLNFKCSALKVN